MIRLTTRVLVALGTTLAITGSPWQATAQEAAAADTPAAEASTNRWPRVTDGPSGVVTVHTPQVDRWPEFDRIEARAAVEVRSAGSEDTAIGVVEFTGDTDTNVELHMVSVENIKIISLTFQGVSDARSQQLASVVRNVLPLADTKVPLSVFLHYLTAATEEETIEGLSHEPPPIFYSETPALLLQTDGEPLLAPIDDTRLQYVINTNWDLFRYRDREWYLRLDEHWLKSKDESVDGTWKYTKKLPKDFSKLPDNDNWTEVRAAMPPAKPPKDPKEPPTILVSERPAELIQVKGQIRFRTIGDQGLTYATNTQSDLFRFEKMYYYLVSGRWFSALRPRGPWTYVARPPQVFASIPEGHAKAHVLAAVPGTEEARLATLEAQIPRKATVRRDAGNNVQVVYNGEPQFEAIEGTDIFRAVNTPDDILRVGNEYYLCANAVWYRSDTPKGPWAVADVIPASVYTIPPSSGSYHVTHVHVYQSDSDTVRTGYTSGYYGVYVSYGVAYYGSGWYYPPYYYNHPYYGYPVYYGYPYSYGASSWYNPNTGMYGRSNSVYGPYGGYGRAASYNPKTGTYARGEAAWDNNEIAGRAVAYNPRTGTGVATNRYVNEDGGWGESLITNDDKWVETRSEWDDNSRRTEFETSRGGSGEIERSRDGDTITGSGSFERGDQSLQTRSISDERGTAVGFETGDGRTGAVGRSTEGDLYAGKDGEVYRRGDEGWQQHGEDGWNNVEVPDDISAKADQRRADAGEAATTRRESRDAAGTDTGQLRSSIDTRRATGDGSFDRRNLDSGALGGNRSTRSNLSNRSISTQRRDQLNRDYRARSSGNQRYQNRQRSQGRAGGMRRMGGRGGGRRR